MSLLPKSRAATRLVAVFAVFVVASAAQASPTYSITDLGTLPGYDTSVATGISDQGQVVGVVTNAALGQWNVPNPVFGGNDPFWNVDASFLYSAGSLTQISPVGGPAEAVNNSGIAVGGYIPSINNQGQYVYPDPVGRTGYLVSGGVTTSLGQFSPLAINDSGVMAGYLNVLGQGTDIAVYQDGHATDLTKALSLNSRSGFAYAINNAGDILLYYMDANSGPQIRLLSHTGQLTGFAPAVPGETLGLPEALNDQGQVLGRNYLYSNGHYDLLQNLIPTSSGWTNVFATALNDTGQIVGFGTIDGQTRAFLMTPNSAQSIPEPSTAMFSLVTLGLVGARCLARRLNR